MNEYELAIEALTARKEKLEREKAVLSNYWGLIDHNKNTNLLGERNKELNEELCPYLLDALADMGSKRREELDRICDAIARFRALSEVREAVKKEEAD